MRIIICVLLSIIFSKGTLYADRKGDFKKGFYLGICKTLLETFPSGTKAISEFQYYITNSGGEKIVKFSLNSSIVKLAEIYRNEPAENRDKIRKFILLVKKYKSGEIMAKELKLFQGIYYYLVHRTNRDYIKFGFINSQVYANVVYMGYSKAPASLKNKARDNLWKYVEQMLMFSPYFFNNAASDKLFVAYLKRDIKAITKLSILFIIQQIDISSGDMM